MNVPFGYHWNEPTDIEAMEEEELRKIQDQNEIDKEWER